MDIDLNEIMAEMTGAVKQELAEDWDFVKEVTVRFFEKRKERLSLLAELRLNGDLTKKQFELRLKHEQKMAEAEFHAIAVITKVKAQNAANAAIDVLKTAVETALAAAI